MIQIIYSRISKEDETIQDIEIQEKKVIEKFSLENPILLKEEDNIQDFIHLNRPLILRERGTAYKMDMFSRRHEFHKFMDFALNYNQLTIKSLFFQKFESANIQLFAWDSHRYMRNMEYGLLFLLLCDFKGIEIYTYKDNRINSSSITPNDKLVKFIILMIHSFSGEEYSYTTSENIKKSVKQKQGITIGTKKNPLGTKWGRPFSSSTGSSIILKPTEINKLNQRIKELEKYYKFRNDGFYYNRIIIKIMKEFNIKISKSYLSYLKKSKE